jgi:Phage tail assembly chaperone proteins, E, or 41 or 14
MAEAEDADAAAPAAAPDADLIVSLDKPIQAHGEELKQIKMREPTVADIEAIGNPVLLDVMKGDEQIKFDAGRMTLMISRLATIPTSSVRMMSTRDWNTVAWRLVRFLMPGV